MLTFNLVTLIFLNSLRFCNDYYLKITSWRYQTSTFRCWRLICKNSLICLFSVCVYFKNSKILVTDACRLFEDNLIWVNTLLRKECRLIIWVPFHCFETCFSKSRRLKLSAWKIFTMFVAHFNCLWPYLKAGVLFARLLSFEKQNSHCIWWCVHFTYSLPALLPVMTL